VRLQADYVSRTLIPAFYRFLQAQNPKRQMAYKEEFSVALEHLAFLLDRGEREVSATGGAGSGLWCEGGESNWTDVMVGPCELRRHIRGLYVLSLSQGLFRASNVLRHYLAFELPAGSKIRPVFAHPSFKATCSTEEPYLDNWRHLCASGK
jgi:glutathione S-transferase